jgi:rare lipoprotein A
LQSNLISVPAPNRRRRVLTAVVLAGILSAVGTGSYVSWSASADERPAEYDGGNLAKSSINVDSLYTAKAEEAPAADSSFLAPVGPDRTISGRVSWYGPGFHGRRTANGERFDRAEMTAAHRTLPFGTLVRVVDAATGKGVLVRVNDRGPFCGGRVMDLSEGAARRLGITGRGTASARLEIYTLPVGSLPKGSQAHTDGAQHDGAARLTFDTEGRAVVAHGFTVKLARIGNFDEAAAELQRLEGQGYKDLLLTQVREGNTIFYELSTGLFSSERLCNSLLAEVSDTFKGATIARFDQSAGGTSIKQLADTSSENRGDM